MDRPLAMVIVSNEAAYGRVARPGKGVALMSMDIK